MRTPVGASGPVFLLPTEGVRPVVRTENRFVEHASPYAPIVHSSTSAAEIVHTAAPPEYVVGQYCS